MHVLVVEDDAAIFEPLLAGLRRNGFDASHSINGTDAPRMVQEHDPDVMLLDLGLPDVDGLDVLRAVRRISDVPIIIASARGDETDRIVGLELGADDYVVKPYSPGRVVPRQELFSRVWDPVWVGSGKSLDVHIATLRRKLGDGSLIETVRGVGYRLVDA